MILGLRRPNSQRVTLEEAVRRYLVYFRNEFGATERSIEGYRGTLRIFARAFPDSLIEEWEPPAGTEALRGFVDARWGHLSSGTRGKVISVFKSFFAYCLDADLLVADPAGKLKRPKRRGHERHAHEPEFLQQIIDAQPALRDKVGIALMARLGLRKNELRMLRFTDIDLDGRKLRVKGKGGKVAMIPLIDDGIVADLRTLAAGNGDGYVLHPVRGDQTKPYEPSSMHRWWATRLKKAGVPHFPMHELRHSAITTFLKATGNLEKTRMFARHESVATTQIYSHLLTADLEDGMRLANDRWVA